MKVKQIHILTTERFRYISRTLKARKKYWLVKTSAFNLIYKNGLILPYTSNTPY